MKPRLSLPSLQRHLRALRRIPRTPDPIWVERALLLVGVICLGIFAWVRLDAWQFERSQERRLEEAIAAAAPSSPPPGPMSAAETDSFDSFRRAAAEIRQDAEEEANAQEGAPEPAESPAPDEKPAGRDPAVREEAPLPAGDEGRLIGRLRIPRVGVSAIVMEGVDKRTLRRAAGHIPATALPGDPAGNVGIAAHRDSLFRGLKHIREDDTIEVTTLDGTYRYQVEWTRVVPPEETSVLNATGQPTLTLVTCYPFHYVGSAPERFIVRARRIEDEISRDQRKETDPTPKGRE